MGLMWTDIFPTKTQWKLPAIGFSKSDLVKGRTHKFTSDALVNVVAHLGYTVKLPLQKVA